MTMAQSVRQNRWYIWGTLDGVTYYWDGRYWSTQIQDRKVFSATGANQEFRSIVRQTYHSKEHVEACIQPIEEAA